MDPIASFSGLASGIQWRDMVDQIMRAERARQVAPLERQQATNQLRRDAWSTYQTLVGRLASAARGVQDGSAFSRFTVSGGTGSGGRQLFTASAADGAAPGSFRVEVASLARAEKLGGQAFASTTASLDLGGEIIINGRRVELADADSLATVRDKINAANSGAKRTGVTATILSTGAGEHRLVLTSDATGSRGIELADSEGGSLHRLGILRSPEDEPVTNTITRGDTAFTQTRRLESSTTPIAAMLGLSSPPEQRQIQIAGVVVDVDLTRDSLESLQRKIQHQQVIENIDPPIAVRIVEESVGGTTLRRLEAEGTVAAAPPGDEHATRTLALLGFTRAGFAAGAEITSGSDAQVKIDGFAVTQRSNTITGVVPGVTLNLLHAEPGSPSDLVIGRDIGAAVSGVRSLATAYNEVRTFLDRQSGAGQPLAGNGSLRTSVAQFTQSILSGVAGLAPSNPFSRSAVAGVALTRTGILDLDDAVLRKALETNPADVRALFGASMASDNPQLRISGGGPRTEPGTYAVEITQAATRATVRSTPAPGTGFVDGVYVPADGVGPDDLVVLDRDSGRSITISIGLDAGVEAVVQELNARFGIDGLRLTASVEDGQIRLGASEHGSRAGVTLSGAAAAQLGFTDDPEASATFSGQDVRAFIYADAAVRGAQISGNGQTLVGPAGSAIEGLVLTYEGSETGGVGTVRFGIGLAGSMARIADRASREGDGLVAGQLDSLSSSSTVFTRRIEEAEARLERRRDLMIRQFARMEQAMSRFQAQGNWLSNQLQAMRPRER
jgi:flagellar hook-associated protein 2